MMLNSPDTLQVLLTGFASMALSMALELMILGLIDIAWSLWFLQPEQNFSNQIVTILWSISPFTQQMFSLLLWHYDPRICKTWIPEKDFIAGSSVQLSNHIQWSNEQHVSTPTTVILPTTEVTSHALVMWYIPHKLAQTKILLNFCLTLIMMCIKYVCSKFSKTNIQC